MSGLLSKKAIEFIEKKLAEGYDKEKLAVFFANEIFKLIDNYEVKK